MVWNYKPASFASMSTDLWTEYMKATHCFYFGQKRLFPNFWNGNARQQYYYTPIYISIQLNTSMATLLPIILQYNLATMCGGVIHTDAEKHLS